MKILVIRLSSFGDVILTTPVLDELKLKYPDGDIDFVVMDKFREAITGNKNINKIIIFEKDKYKGIGGIKKFVEEIKGNNYDIVIDLHAKTRSILMTKMLGVPKVYRYKKRSIVKSLLIKARIIKNNYDESIIRKYFRPLKKLGIEYKGENLTFNFEEKDKVKCEEVYKTYGEYIVLAPGASKGTKKWPAEYFGELGKKIVARENKAIVLIGGKSEYEELENIKNIIGERCYNGAGKFNLKESGAVLQRAIFAVTNDSGPFHIARGVGTKAYVIFGPTDPKMFEYSEKAVLIFAGANCSPCSLHGDEVCPRGHFECMRSITPDKVMEIIKEK